MDKKKDEEIKGIRKISTFVTADALLAAVLMVWAQLWIQPSIRLWAAWYGMEQPEKVSNTLKILDFNVGLGLIWTYSAVFLALLALAWASLRTLKSPSDRVPATAFGLFWASVIIAIIDVSQSIYSVSKKLLSGSSIWLPLSEPRCFLYLTVVFIPVIIGFSIWCAHKMSKN